MSTLAIPLNALGSDDLAFLAFPSKDAAQQVTGTTEDLFQNFGTIINAMLSDVIDTKTEAQYRAARDKHVVTYTQVMMGLGQVIRATVPDQVIDRLTRESLAGMEADFRDHGDAAFGIEIKDQAMFTVWTLRKIFDLVLNNLCAPPAAELVEADREMARYFSMHILYGRFHLDCLIMSLRKNTPIYPEVLDCLSEGLRSIVNAYAKAKEACALRNPKSDEEMVDIEFDDEERDLLDLSMRDVHLEA